MIERRIALLRDDASGSSLVELALSMGIVLLLIFGILEVCRAFYVDHYIGYAARDGARYAMVRGSTWSGAACGDTSTFSCTATAADVQKYVRTLAPPGVDVSQVAVTTTWSGGSASGGGCINVNGNNSPGCAVAVSVSYNFQFLLPLLPANLIAMNSSSSGTIAQ